MIQTEHDPALRSGQTSRRFFQPRDADSSSDSDVLLETVALSPHEGSQVRGVGGGSGHGDKPAVSCKSYWRMCNTPAIRIATPINWLHDVYVLFERDDESENCPIGGCVCGGRDKCPMHDRFAEVREAMDRVLRKNTFDTFQLAFKKSDGKAGWRLAGT